MLLETLAGLGLLGLVMFGAGMTVYRLIAPEGWLARLLGSALSSGAAALVSLMVIGVLAWFSREWITPERKNRYAELILYGFAAAGMLYLAQLWLAGTL
ncbi:MAG: hypothetical protein M0015_17165 [Betaproteobacteria bacterium]|nr:hypothetical protein [Betaproteobacteria bacterium]